MGKKLLRTLLQNMKNKEQQAFLDMHTYDESDPEEYGSPQKKFKKDHSRRADKEPIETVNVSEEQLDEISKKTLGNYIKKAGDSVDRNSWKSGYFGRGTDSADTKAAAYLQKKSDKRLKGISRATDKLTKEDLDEAFVDGRVLATQGKIHPNHAKFMKVGEYSDFYHPSNGDKHYGKVRKNDGKEVHIQSISPKGINTLHKFKISDKLDESVDQIDEISYDTLKSYRSAAGFNKSINKATLDHDKKKQNAGVDKDEASKEFRQKEIDRSENNLRKRDAGEKLLKKKLGEEVDQIDENKVTIEPINKKGFDHKYRIINHKTGYEDKAHTKKEANKIGSEMAAKHNLAFYRIDESEEQIDELSKGTLGSYINKAATKMGQAHSEYDSLQGNDTSTKKAKAKAEKKYSNRAIGIEMAVRKLTKEDINEDVKKDFSRLSDGKFMLKYGKTKKMMKAALYAEDQKYMSAYRTGDGVGDGSGVDESMLTFEELKSQVEKIKSLNKKSKDKLKKSEKRIEFMRNFKEGVDLDEDFSFALEYLNILESDALLLMSLFNEVNEEAKIHMIECVSDEDAINELLDIAINETTSDKDWKIDVDNFHKYDSDKREKTIKKWGPRGNYFLKQHIDMSKGEKK